MKLWSDLTQSDKNHVVITVILGLLFLVLVLIAFLVSRGNDVDYFKNRIFMIEQRTLYMDQKMDKMNEKLLDYRRELNQLRQKEDELERKLQEHSYWIEHWKSLPQLPKPHQKR